MRQFNDWFIQKACNFLSSSWGFWMAFLGPLAAILAPTSIQRIENIISSNWIQLWALFGMSIISAKGLQQSKENAHHIKRIHKHLGIKQ